MDVKWVGFDFGQCIMEPGGLRNPLLFGEIYKELGSFIRAVVLFGSTARKTKTPGGDIDLLLRTPEAILMAVKKQSISLNTDMQNRIGEQKIDLLIVSDQPPQDPFHEIAIEQAVLIKAW